MKILTAGLLVIFATQNLFAKTMTDRFIESKNIIGLVYEDEQTGDKCALSQAPQIIEALGLPACTDKQEEFIKEINDAPKNPDLAIVGAVVDVVLGYYSLCSLAQAAPYVVEKVNEATDDRSRTEKIRDIFVPSEDQRKRNSFEGTVKEVSKDLTTTVCRPVAAFNKKLYYLLSDKENSN